MMKVLLGVEKLTKTFGGLRALDGVSFSLSEGEILGLLGPNGAGKTVCFNLISGVYRPDDGRVFFQGQETTGFPPNKMAGLGLGRTFQIVKPFSSLTVLENVMAALGLTYYSTFIKMWSFWNTSNIKEKAMAQLGRVGLADLANRKAGLLPLGNLRRLEIARALCVTQKLILLDEPFSGLRQSEIDQLKELILSIREQGISFLLIEHNIKLATGLSDRLVILDHGRLLCEGNPGEVCRDSRVVEAYLGRRKEIKLCS